LPEGSETIATLLRSSRSDEKISLVKKDEWEFAMTNDREQQELEIGASF
jgi:hypothetical protein